MMIKERASKLPVKKALAAFFLLGSSGAHADLLEYQYTDTNGETKKSLPSHVYANPTSDITFHLSAGIDRKVKVSIIGDDGRIISTKTSHLLGASDRINIRGKSYYGASLNLPKPSSDGKYKIKSEIISSSDKAVQSDEYELTLDTVAPNVTGKITRITDNKGTPSVLTNRSRFDRELRLGGITDSGVGLESAKYFTIDSNGVRKEINVSLDPDAGTATIPVSSAASSSMMPVDRAEYTIGFRLVDKAGNIKNVSTNSKLDNVLPSVEIEVFDNKSDSWVSYEKNMKVYNNPVKVRYKRKKSEHVEFNGTDYGWATGYNAQDDNYVYKVVNLNYPQKYSYFNLYTKAGRDFTHRYESLKFTLSGSAVKGPEPKAIYHHLKGEGWVSSGRPRYSKPYTIDKVRIYADKRPYQQKAWLNGFTPCTIEVNQTYCEANVKISRTSGRGYSPIHFYVSKMNGSFSNHGGYLYTYWDMNKPTIKDLQANLKQGTVSMLIVDRDRTNSHTKNEWNTLKFGVYAVQGDKRIALPKVSQSQLDYQVKSASFNIKGLNDGEYNFVAEATDTYGNKAVQDYGSLVVVDNSAPLISIGIKDGQSIKSLDEILISLTDTIDTKPQVTSIALTGGPADEKVQLSWRESSKGEFNLEYPLLFPSLKAGESYTLNVSAEDEQGNIAQETVTFEYLPEIVTLKNGMDGNLYIPNIQQPITREDGSNIIETEPFTLSDGSLVTGSYDVYATLRSDADYPMVINGVEIQPGETTSVLDQHNFASSDGRLSIPMYASNDTIGQANVMISTAAPNSPILLLDVKTWKAEGKLSAESWEVRQVVDNLHILASPAPGTICRFTSDRKQAEAADPLKDPTCYIEWISIPDESEEQMITLDGLRVAGIVGQAMSLGEQPIRYRLSMFSGSNKIYLGEGERMLKVLPAEGSIAVSPPASSLKAHRTIGDVSIPFVQDKGPECSLTLDANVALREAQNRPFTSKSRTCLFEYQNIPDGLVQSIRSNEPLLTGTQDINGDSDIGWRISMYARSGSRISLNTQEAKLNIVDPSAPEIEVESKYHLRDNVYVVPFQESPTWLGDANVSGVSANIDVGLYRDDELLEEDTYSGGYGDRTSIDRPLDALPQSVWNKQVFSVLANFSDLPEIKSEKSIEVFTAPSLSVAPVISSKEDAAINSALLPVTVSIHDSRKRNDSYEPNYGNWEVRVLSEERYGKNRPLSDWQVTDFNGEAGFEVPLHDVDSNRVRLVAEARLLSEVEGYERTEFSRRPMTMQLLRGNSIESSVVSRRLSGPAPFSTVFKVDLEERLDLRALDTVTWYLSDDGGSTWVEQNLSSRSDMVFVKNFEEGKYQIKAKTRNANSGAEKFTEIVEVVAFPMAEFDIEGPLSLYPDDTGNYTLNGLVGDVEITEENSEIEWSLDGGKNYTVFGPTVSLTQSHTGNVRLAARVRSKMAPGESRASWEMARVSVSFRRIRPPKLRIVGPSRVESGVEYEYAANISAPYRGINYPINGYWILPDGEKVEGFNLKYTPTSDDALRGSVNLQYVAWVEGYRERGAETSAKRRSRVWQYKWPNFSIGARQSASVAPADVVVSVRKVAHRGALEEPVYTWTFPEGIQPLDARNPTIRKVNIKEEGVYPVTVEITDARGNKTTLTEEVTLGAFDPFELTLDPRASNEYYRAPLSVYIRPRVDAGHPRDRIENYRYFVNGEEVLQERKSSSTRLTLDEGTHKVKLVAETKMGFSSEVTEEIVVKANKNPVCNLETRDRSNGWSVTADCNDEDGRVRGFEWSLSDGTEQASGSRRMGLTKWNYPDGVTVTVVAVDDAEGRSTPVSVVLKPEVEEPEEM